MCPRVFWWWWWCPALTAALTPLPLAPSLPPGLGWVLPRRPTETTPWWWAADTNADTQPAWPPTVCLLAPTPGAPCVLPRRLNATHVAVALPLGWVCPTTPTAAVTALRLLGPPEGPIEGRLFAPALSPWCRTFQPTAGVDSTEALAHRGWWLLGALALVYALTALVWLGRHLHRTTQWSVGAP